MRPKDEEMTAVEEIICFSQFPRDRKHSGHAGPQGECQEAPGPSGVPGESLDYRLYGGFSISIGFTSMN